MNIKAHLKVAHLTCPHQIFLSTCLSHVGQFIHMLFVTLTSIIVDFTPRQDIGAKTKTDRHIPACLVLAHVFRSVTLCANKLFIILIFGDRKNV